MKILYVSQYFPPEIGAPAARVEELSKIWVEAGQDVTVLTGFPHHPTGKVPREYRWKLLRLFMRDDRDGIKVRRTWLIPLPNRKSWERMVTYASFCVSAIWRGAFLSRPDVVIATSPQLLVGVAGLAIAWMKRVPFVFEVRDLWPESLEAVRVGSAKSLVVRMLKRVAGMLYRKSDCIVVVTNAFKEHLEREWKVPSEKIFVVVNGVNHKLFFPREAPASLVRDFMLLGRFVVGYIGTMGNAHGPETLVAAAEIIEKKDREVLFFVVGEGAEKENFERMVVAKGLENMRICSAKPRSDVPSLIACARVCLVTLRNAELFKTVIPTKILEFMACGRPVIAASEGEAARLIHSAHAGLCTPPEDAVALAEAILFLKNKPELLRTYGENARRYVVEKLTREQTGEEYLVVLQKVVGGDLGEERDQEEDSGQTADETELLSVEPEDSRKVV
jgi:colanic acid biosynthesis glycosyl transferase WcaI